MTTLTQASQQWATRPSDQRFTSLLEMQTYTGAVRANSRAVVLPNRKLDFAPANDDQMRGLVVAGPNGHAATMSHWSFGQLCSLAGAPAGYLRNLPSPIAADALNYSLKFSRDIEEVGVLLHKPEPNVVELRAATGPNYGRVWNTDVVGALVQRFGDGLTGPFRVPGEFGKRVDVTKENTTLYASDRDMFVFLADETRRIELPNRRDGKTGTLARGFFVWNSEVGGGTLGVAMFLFDYVCCNRMVWGAQGYQELKVRHTSGAPHRWVEQVQPRIQAFANASEAPVLAAIEAARADRLSDVAEFLATRFGKGMVGALQTAHKVDEQRPIETRWDVVTAATAYARTIPHQNERVNLERTAGALLAA